MKFEALAFVACLAVAPHPASAEDPAPESSESSEEAASSETAAEVHVIADNIESAGGTVWLALCDTSLSVEGCPYKKGVEGTAGFVEVTFENIPPGVYAVVGYHDVNGNDEFDSWLGVPSEPYALSGPAGDMLVPTFKDAAIEIKAGPNDVILRMGGIADW
jgi:uncharacterized protein (DUF2141 family)